MVYLVADVFQLFKNRVVAVVIYFLESVNLPFRFISASGVYSMFVPSLKLELGNQSNKSD